MTRAVLLSVAFTAAALFCPRHVGAEHGSPYVRVSPCSNRIPPNGRIQLISSNGVAWYVGWLYRKSPDFKIYLIPKTRKARSPKPSRSWVSLRVADAFDDLEGQPRGAFVPGAGYGESVLVLTPRRRLRRATTYDLALRYKSTRPKPGWTVLDIEQFKTTSRPDRKRPRWRQAPFLEYRKKKYERGDWPTIVAEVTGETGPINLVLTLKPVRSGKAKRMVVVYDPRLNHSYRRPHIDAPSTEICQSVHVFGTEKDVGKWFLARLEAVDIAGNRSRAPGRPLIVQWEQSLNLALCLRKPASWRKTAPATGAGTP